MLRGTSRTLSKNFMTEHKAWFLLKFTQSEARVVGLKEVKEKFKEIAMSIHPDVRKETGPEQDFSQVIAARNYLIENMQGIIMKRKVLEGRRNAPSQHQYQQHQQHRHQDSSQPKMPSLSKVKRRVNTSQSPPKPPSSPRSATDSSAFHSGAPPPPSGYAGRASTPLSSAPPPPPPPGTGGDPIAEPMGAETELKKKVRRFVARKQVQEMSAACLGRRS
eukprot:TRINITY_DN6240_c0_g1_i1.p1 TRINITY_DN6240_c0_g1~~TRINITY_DN6240_c0_g1_i1.p1  ORF type:complete len:247 (+),score=31.22 TRINITY_DN6240_c0_g1_i1:87-743(+)